MSAFCAYSRVMKDFDQLLVSLEKARDTGLSMQQKADIRHYADVLIQNAVNEFCDRHSAYQQEQLCD